MGRLLIRSGGWQDDDLGGLRFGLGRLSVRLGALFVVYLLLVVLLGRPVRHWYLLIESWSREWPLYV